MHVCMYACVSVAVCVHTQMQIYTHIYILPTSDLYMCLYPYVYETYLLAEEEEKYIMYSSRSIYARKRACARAYTHTHTLALAHTSKLTYLQAEEEEACHWARTGWAQELG